MAGLESNFLSRANQYGATANTMGEGQVPKGLHMSPLPAVSGDCSIETKVLLTNSPTAQVSPTRQPLGWATLLPSLGRTPRRKKVDGVSGGRSAAGNNNIVPTQAIQAPAPNASLVARLSLKSATTVLSAEKRTNMKSVEATPAMFKDSSRKGTPGIHRKIDYSMWIG